MSLLKNPLFIVFLLVGICLSSCNHKGNITGNNVDLDQNVTTVRFPLDSVFLHFETGWKKFINSSIELQKPVLENQAVSWTPAVISDCRFSAELGHNVPVVQLTWNETASSEITAADFRSVQGPVSEKSYRFDISQHYKGFERNYYTTVFPVKGQQRFSIPLQSAFTHDTAAVVLTGPSLLPKVVDFQQIMVKVNQTPMLKKTLSLTELGAGTSYRIRICAFNGVSWVPSQQFVFSTPVCPLDRD